MNMEMVIAEDRFPGRLVNINDERGHTRVFARKRAPWRTLGYLLARGRTPVETPVTITVLFRWPDARVRDSPNWYPTAKALIDGIVSAGVLVADDDRHVWLTSMGPDVPHGPKRITLRIEEVT
jgi:crossover junction endodeoxyribonuclease RusA